MKDASRSGTSGHGELYLTKLTTEHCFPFLAMFQESQLLL